MCRNSVDFVLNVDVSRAKVGAAMIETRQASAIGKTSSQCESAIDLARNGHFSASVLTSKRLESGSAQELAEEPAGEEGDSDR